MNKKLFLITLLCGNFINLFPAIWEQEIRWDWDKIDLSDDTFWQSLANKSPKDFQWGGAASAFQSEGVQIYDNKCVENNWTQDPLLGKQYKNTIGSDHWNRYKHDVQLLKKLGFNSYRFSVAWEKIEPEEGQFDQRAMDHYRDLCRELRKSGIEPWVCLFHFTLPTWLADSGGFENEENIKYFVRFCKYVFENLHDQVHFWASYNEPIAYAMEAYFRGTFPPHKKNFRTAGIVFKNMLNAHVTIYHEFKSIDETAQIGIIKFFHPLEPYSWWNPIERLAAKLGNYLVHDTVLNFFKDGTYNWLFAVRDTNVNARGTLDFIGVNYYRHEIIQVSPLKIGTLKAREFEQRVPDNNRSIYPEGLYRSIEKAATLNLPIYITENGIADATDLMRNEFIKKHLYVIQCALENGYDIRGYHYWTPIDSIGWTGQYKSKYGFYAVDPDSMERTFRTGAQPFINFLKGR